tara:strand:- start:279 stop:467 length:189 start_codon:yes stop_codon:yes gene_type:complete
MAKEKAIKATKEIIESKDFKKYKSDELVDTFKGKVNVLDSEKSEIAKKLEIKKNGSFAIKLR